PRSRLLVPARPALPRRRAARAREPGVVAMNLECLTLEEAAQRCRELFPSGRITVRSLRTEKARGRLRTFKVAGKVFTTEADLLAMIERARCQDRARDRDSTSAAGADAQPHGSSGTER